MKSIVSCKIPLSRGANGRRGQEHRYFHNRADKEGPTAYRDHRFRFRSRLFWQFPHEYKCHRQKVPDKTGRTRKKAPVPLSVLPTVLSQIHARRSVIPAACPAGTGHRHTERPSVSPPRMGQHPGEVGMHDMETAPTVNDRMIGHEIRHTVRRCRPMSVNTVYFSFRRHQMFCYLFYILNHNLQKGFPLFLSFHLFYQFRQSAYAGVI